MRSLTKAAALLAAVATVAAGCGGSSVVPSGPVDLDKLRESKIPVYYLGESFSGLDLSYADTPGADRALLTYGTCKAESGSSCSPPLEIQTCLDSETVSLLGRQTLAERASSALRPLNKAARQIAHPRMTVNQGLRCA
jgi:hypothetical protein